MNSEKWEKAKLIYRDALKHPPGERRSFLEQNCDDAEILAEVESLLASSDEAGSFLESSPIGEMAETVVKESSLIGRDLLHYKIIDLLGAGGMGEVYLAEDTNLKRRVAIKFLPVELTRDEKYLQRFQREARAASSLNHPNILTIHELGRSDDTHFIVSEFVDGESLGRVLARERLSITRVLEIVEQTASALAAAHDAGIVHRDIKPDNVMIRRDGLVKVLDFGLAKIFEPASGNEVARVTPKELTKAGMIMGTPSYMSPEQARGKEIDHRTDIFSLGVMLYEMLAGHAPFAGDSTSDIVAAVLTSEPKALDEVPGKLEEITFKALEKDRDDRYSSVGEMLANLKEAKGIHEFSPGNGKPAEFIDDPSKTRLFEHTTAGQDIIHSTQQPDAAQTIAGTELELVNTKKDRSSVGRWLLTGLLGVVLTVGGYFGYHSLTHSTQIDSIAIIPFSNESGNSEIEYLSDGMAEKLISDMSLLPDLNVRPRSSVFRYKGKDFDAKKIAAELDVDAILTGNVRQNGNEIVLSIELIDPIANRILWKGDYNRPMQNLVELQSQIALDVSSKVKAKLSSTEEKQLAKMPTSNPEAYQRYLQGRFLLNGRGRSNGTEAIEQFNRAIELDPNFAAAHAGLADAYTILGTTTSARMTPQEAMPKAKEAAQKAVALDPESSEAHTSLGWIKFRFDWDWAGAEAEFKRALELNPKNSQARHWYGEFLNCQKRIDESISELRIARDLEPFSAEIRWNLGKNLYNAEKYEEAIVELKKALEGNNKDWRAANNLYQSLKKLGRTKEAYDALKTSRLLMAVPFSAEELAGIDKIYEQKGLDAAAKRLAELRLSKFETIGLNPYAKSMIYLELENNQKALDLLEQAYNERFGSMVSIYSASVFEILKNEPRYQALLRKMNFPVQ